MSDPQRPSRAQEALDRYYPEITYPPLREKVRKATTLAEILQRHEAGKSEQGDWFKAARLLLTLSKREMIDLALDLANRDEVSFFPLLLALVPRKLDHFDRAREKYTNKARREYEKEKRRERTVALVAMRQMDTGESLEEAFKALGKMVGFTYATVKADYMAAIKKVRSRGFAVWQPPNHMVKPTQIKMDPQSPKGRRLQKG
jgi:hypothetical protein